MRKTKFRLADVELARATDFGRNDDRVVVLSHLGNLLHVGDYCQGYDLRTINLSGYDDIMSAIRERLQSDVIIVKKILPPHRQVRKRKWMLQTLPKEKDVTMAVGKDRRADDMKENDEFLRDLEEDEEMRREVNLWKNPRAQLDVEDQSMMDEDDDDADSFGRVDLAELLEGLTLEDDHKPPVQPSVE